MIEVKSIYILFNIFAIITSTYYIVLFYFLYLINTFFKNSKADVPFSLFRKYVGKICLFHDVGRVKS